MVNRSSSLLALIHQHLLKNGYAKAARELEIESGEKFTAQKMSLKKMYKHWNKKGKKKKKKKKDSKVNESKSKEPRVQDPDNVFKFSVDEENALPKVTDLVAQGKKKKASAKKVSKVTREPAKSKKMNSARKSASKVKDATKKVKPSLCDKPVATETLIAEALAKSSGDSDSEEETVPAAPVQEPPLKATRAADPKSKKTASNTKSKAAKHKKTRPAKTTPAAAPIKSLSASNGKDAVNSDISESSDETDIEKQPVAVTPSITALFPVKASKKKTETPSTVVQPTVDSSESSESESEEEPVKQKVSARAAPQVKATARSSKTTKAQEKATKGSAITKATVTPASRGRTAAKKAPAKTVVEESSEDSDSDNELVPSTPSPAPPSSSKASKQKVQIQPTAPPAEADDSSASSETDLEEEPVSQKMPEPDVAANVEPPVNEAVIVSQTKPATRNSNHASADTAVTVMSENSASLGKTQSPTEAEVSKTSDSDSETEPENRKTTASPKKGAKPASAQASKPVPVVSPGSESSEDSDSADSEPKAPEKTVNDLPSSKGRRNVKQPVATSLLAKARTSQPAPVDDSSETDDSDSDEEPEPKKTGSQLQASAVKTPSKGVTPGKPRTPLKTAAPAADTSESDDSDSDEEPGATKNTSPLAVSGVTAPSLKQSGTPNTPAGKAGNLLKPPATADDSSETDDSDSDEDQGAKKNTSHLPASGVTAPSLKQSATPNTPAGKAGNLLKPPATADDSSETDDSDSDEDQAAKKSASSVPASNVKTGAKHPVTLAANAAVGKTTTPLPADDSSETDDSDSDEPLVKSSSAVKASGPTTTTVKPSVASAARVPDSDADSESSDFSDSEKKKGQKTSASQAKTAPKLASPVGKTMVPGKMTTDSKPALSEDSSETSESEDEIPQKTAPSSVNKTAATPPAATLCSPQKKTPASGKVTATKNPPVSSSETSDSSDDDEHLPPVQKTNAAAVAKQKASTFVPLLTSTPSIDRPAKGKAGLHPNSPKPAKTAQSSDSQSSGKEAKQVGTPAPTPAKAAVKKETKSASQSNTGARKRATAKVSSESSESDSSDGNEAKKGTPATAASKTPQGKLANKVVKTPGSSILATPKTQVTSPTKTPTVLKKTAAESSSESSDSEEDLALKKGTPATAASKTPQGKLANKVVKTPSSSILATPKTQVTSPTKTPTVLKKTAAESSSESSDSEDDLALKVKNQVSAVDTKHGKSVPAAKPKSPVKTLLVSKAPTDESSDNSSDSEDEEINRPKITSLISSPKAAAKTGNRVSADLPGNAAETADDTSISEPEESQSLLKAQHPTKRKRTLKTEDKTTPAKPSKKSKVPTTPGGLLESEEETVLALLEGRSPQKAKNKPSKKTPDVTTATVEDSKSAKKRKNSSGDELAEKAKKSKKEKKDTQVKAAEEAPSLTSSKEENKKSGKGKKKKEKKESENLEQSVTAPESTDSGVGLQSKPKKKKKVKGERD